MLLKRKVVSRKLLLSKAITLLQTGRFPKPINNANEKTSLGVKKKEKTRKSVHRRKQPQEV